MYSYYWKVNDSNGAQVLVLYRSLSSPWGDCRTGVSEDSITSCYEVIDEIRTYSHPES